MEEVAQIWLPELVEQEAEVERAADQGFSAKTQEGDGEDLEQKQFMAKAMAEAAEETQKHREFMEQARARVRLQEHQTQAFLDHLVNESLQAVAGMQKDFQDWRQQWQVECASMTTAAKEGGVSFTESVKGRVEECWANMAAECTEMKRETCDEFKQLSARMKVLSKEVSGKCQAAMERLGEKERRSMRDSSSHARDLVQNIALHCTGTLQDSVGEIIAGVMQGAQWAKETGGEPPQHGQRVFKILAECERIAKNLKSAEAKAKRGEEKAIVMERGLYELSCRMDRMEQSQSLSGRAFLGEDAPGGGGQLVSDVGAQQKTHVLAGQHGGADVSNAKQKLCNESQMFRGPRFIAHLLLSQFTTEIFRVGDIRKSRFFGILDLSFSNCTAS